MPYGKKLTVEESINFYHPDYRTKIAQDVENLIEHGLEYDGEYKFIDYEGTEKWVRSKGVREVDEEGNTILIRGTFQDITDRKETMHDLEILRSRMHLATKLAGIGVWEYNITKNEYYWSDKMYELFGITEKQFDEDRNVYLERVHPEDRVILETNLNKCKSI